MINMRINFYKIIIFFQFFLVSPQISLSENLPHREYIYITGSSTISHLSAIISEEFARKQSLKGKYIQTPYVEVVGTNDGLEVFCSGIGSDYPDFVNASKKINEKELKICKENKIKEPVEITIGYDGIVIAGNKNNKSFDITSENLFKALAEKVFVDGKLVDNPYKKWSEIDKSLPELPIIFYGPSESSGTYDLLEKMALGQYCMNNEAFKKYFKNHKKLKKQCIKLRDDGTYIKYGENDNNIMKKIISDKNSLGIFGYNFLYRGSGQIKAYSIDGIKPDYKNIASKEYKLSRPLFIYFKQEHININDYIKSFILEIIDEKTIGEKGYLKNSGLIGPKKENIIKQTEIIKKALPLESNIESNRVFHK